MTSKKELIKHWISSGIITDKNVVGAFKNVPREIFINENNIHEAYGDYPLAIGMGQTISQPTTVMMMTEALELNKGDKVLEIGTGSGYQAAIIANIVGKKGKVISTEIIADLCSLAQKNILKLKLKNIKIVHCDGSKGYKNEAPYDRIIVTAACPKIPEPLVGELKENGIIVAPVGNMNEQIMIKAKKNKGKLIEEKLGHFMFVPLRGKHGYN